MSKIRLSLIVLVSIIGYSAYLFGVRHLVLGSAISNFTQTINSGTLSVDIVNASYASVTSPAVALGAKTFSFTCQSSTGTLGTASQMIYVQNPDAADGGWTVSIVGSAGTASIWDGASNDFDFNDPTGSGCTDGADSPDTVGGQMTVDASGGTLSAGNCSSCTTTNVTRGNSATFSSGVTDSITVLSGAAGSDDIGDWTLTGVAITQTIPAELPAAADYDINMQLSIVAS